MIWFKYQLNLNFMYRKKSFEVFLADQSHKIVWRTKRSAQKNWNKLALLDRYFSQFPYISFLAAKSNFNILRLFFINSLQNYYLQKIKYKNLERLQRNREVKEQKEEIKIKTNNLKIVLTWMWVGRAYICNMSFSYHIYQSSGRSIIFDFVCLDLEWMGVDIN